MDSVEIARIRVIQIGLRMVRTCPVCEQTRSVEAFARYGSFCCSACAASVEDLSALIADGLAVTA